MTSEFISAVLLTTPFLCDLKPCTVVILTGVPESSAGSISRGKRLYSETAYTLKLEAGKGKGTVHPRTGHEGPEGGMCISLLFL